MQALRDHGVEVANSSFSAIICHTSYGIPFLLYLPVPSLFTSFLISRV